MCLSFRFVASARGPRHAQPQHRAERHGGTARHAADGLSTHHAPHAHPRSGDPTSDLSATPLSGRRVCRRARGQSRTWGGALACVVAAEARVAVGERLLRAPGTGHRSSSEPLILFLSLVRRASSLHARDTGDRSHTGRTRLGAGEGGIHLRKSV
eukprot:7231677-Prymnesium_polylepis.1